MIKKNGVLLLMGVCLVLLLLTMSWLSSNDLSGRRVLRIYTYNSFMGSFGPASLLEAEFEKNCLCEIHWIQAGDSSLMVERLKITRGKEADLIVGLDQFSVLEAENQWGWRPVHLDAVKPVQWRDEVQSLVRSKFIPFDWAPMTFIFRKAGVESRDSMSALLGSDPEKYQMSLQDPRTSTPGLQFLYWIYVLSDGNLGDIWSKLSPFVQSISPSWSSSYGMFRSGHAEITFSYLTSPLYHWIEENQEDVYAMHFKEGHPMQVEFAAIPDTCKECDLAEKFIGYLVSPSAQKIVALKNYMFPAIQMPAPTPEFNKLPKLKVLPNNQLDAFVQSKEEILQSWKELVRE